MAVVISWNVAGRKTSLPEQAKRLLQRDVELICLQEVTPTTASLWEAQLSAAGFHVATSQWQAKPERARRLGVLIASTEPLTSVSSPAGLPWPERHMAVATSLAGIETEIHTLHVPLSSKPDLAKVLTLEQVFAALVADDRPRVLAGDLNTPQYEARDGKVVSFARSRDGLLRLDRGERHDRAELGLVAGLPRAGWHDAFRRLHGYERRDRSWTYASRPFGYRLDHIICSHAFEPLACEYLHDWREQGLSDHSAIWAELASAPDRS